MYVPTTLHIEKFRVMRKCKLRKNEMGLESSYKLPVTPHTACRTADQDLHSEAVHQGFQPSLVWNHARNFKKNDGWILSAESFMQSVWGMELGHQIQAP